MKRFLVGFGCGILVGWPLALLVQNSRPLKYAQPGGGVTDQPGPTMPGAPPPPHEPHFRAPPPDWANA